MSASDVPRTHTFRSFHRHFLTIGAIMLMCSVWLAFFLWAVLLTKYMLVTLDTVAPFTAPGTWQYVIKHRLEADAVLYLPAIILLLTSLLIFFYRVPRVRGRLTIPLEFAVTTLLFIAINLATLFALHRLTLPVQAAYVEAGASGLDVSMAAFELSAAITVGMLAVLFWAQGVGSLRSYWRRLRQPRPAQPRLDPPAPARSAHLVQ
jgi:hypothetical protein